VPANANSNSPSSSILPQNFRLESQWQRCEGGVWVGAVGGGGGGGESHNVALFSSPALKGGEREGMDFLEDKVAPNASNSPAVKKVSTAYQTLPSADPGLDKARSAFRTPRVRSAAGTGPGGSSGGGGGGVGKTPGSRIGGGQDSFSSELLATGLGPPGNTPLSKLPIREGLVTTNFDVAAELGHSTPGRGGSRLNIDVAAARMHSVVGGGGGGDTPGLVPPRTPNVHSGAPATPQIHSTPVPGSRGTPTPADQVKR
jgi:hypothetical protein